MTDLLAAMMAAAGRAAEVRQRADASGAVGREAANRRPRASAFADALHAPGINIVAECKRRSPSKGILRGDYDPAALARGYEANRAAAISVLTEPTFFDGSLAHLREVRAAVGLPLLRKDFISTEYQMVEARAAGADAVLLIVAALDDVRLAALIADAGRHGLAALVEVHGKEELTRALAAGASIVGVNSRDLKTLDVHTAIFDELVLGIPTDVVAVAESGLTSPDELTRLRAAGYDAFLMGERFMREPDPGRALGEVCGAATAALEDVR